MSPAAKHASVTLLWGEDEFLLRERALELLGELKPTEVDAAEWQGERAAGPRHALAVRRAPRAA